MNYENLPITPIPPIPLPESAPAAPAETPPSGLRNSAPTPPRAALPDHPYTLPNGRPLLFSLSIDAIMHQLFAGEEYFSGCPTKPMEVFTFLYLCAHPPAPGQAPVWEAMDFMDTGEDQTAWLPLYLRPFDLFRTALQWFEAEGMPIDFPGYAILSAGLWNHHKSAEVILDPAATTGTLPEKKNPAAATLIPSMSSSTSSPEAIPSSGTMSSTASPSATPSPPATATSSA